MKYAIIKDAVVANIVVADEALQDNWVQVDDTVKIGDFKNSDGTYTTPDMTWDDVRKTRLLKLTTEFDPIATNVARWNDLSTADRNAWTQYRRDWLDITDQDVEPKNAREPIEPYWHPE